MTKLFGTDGIRGVANQDLTGELAFRLGRAVVVALSEEGEGHPEIVVGRDTRASSEFLQAALAAGICSAGGDAVLVDVIPTPAVAFLTADLGAQAGAVISASHNPAPDNGIKFFGPNGFKLPDELEEHVESILGEDRGPRPTGRGVGRIRTAQGGMERYVRHIIGAAPAPAALAGMRVVVDCANGAASDVAPDVLRRLGAVVVPMNIRPDGWNINDGCGATHPDVVARAVVDTGADAGVAHDGDADRALFADHLGQVVDGDQVLAASALDLHERADLAGNTVVTTVMANVGFRRAMADAGIHVLETKVGDRYVLEEMERAGATLGGEQSGHVIFRRFATTGDGLLTAVRFLGLAGARGTSVADLASCMRKFPQVLINVPVGDRNGLAGAQVVWDAVAAAEGELGENGRVLVRASGTEPLVRVMVEATTEALALGHAEALAGAVREALGLPP